MGTNGQGRTRNWTCVIYPPTGAEGEKTECPENWVEILSEMGVKCAVSPLHDRDVKDTGELKKPHRHVVFAYDGVKTETQVRADFKKIGGVGCEVVRSLYNMARYLTHKDDPNKAQYSARDVLTFGGFEYKRYCNTKEDEEKDVVANMGKIFNICAERSMYDFAETAEYLMCNEPELFTTYRKNPYFFATFFKSKEKFYQKMLDIEKERMYYSSIGGLHNIHNGCTTEENSIEQGGTNENQIPNTNQEGGQG